MFNFISAMLISAALLASNGPVQTLEDCTIPLNEIEGAPTHLRNMQERVDNLTELFVELQNGDTDGEELAYEFAYWTVMAENSVELNEGIEYPSCEEYTTLNDTFLDLITDMYAVSAQSTLMVEGRLTDSQKERVQLLLKTRLDRLIENLTTWYTAYELAKDI